MADKYDERARELMPDCKCRGAQFYTCTLCDGTRERRCDREDIAAALRAAAAEEREACAKVADAVKLTGGVSLYRSEKNAVEMQTDIVRAIRARGEVSK